MNPPRQTRRERHPRGWRRLGQLGVLSWLGAIAPPGVAQTNAAPTAAPAQSSILHVGLSDFAFQNVNLNDATAAYGIFVKELTHTHDFEAIVQTEIFTDPALYKTALSRESEGLQISSMPAWDYLSIEPPPNQVPRFVTRRNGQIGRRYLVLTKRGQGFDQLADLRGQAITRLDNTATGAAAFWLQTELLEAGLPTPAEYFGELTTATKAASTILPVFFGKQAACLVDEPSFELMQELNPQVGTSLQVIARSESFTDIVICINDQGWPSAQQKADMLATIPQLGDSPAGRQVLTLFKIDGLTPFQDHDLEGLRTLRRRWETAREGRTP